MNNNGQVFGFFADKSIIGWLFFQQSTYMKRPHGKGKVNGDKFKRKISEDATVIKFLLTSLFISSLVCSTNTFSQSSFKDLIINENAAVAICGDLNYKRQSRDCINDHVDLKRCLELDAIDPLFIFQEEKSYSCVNSSYTHGVAIIGDELETSERLGGCLAKGVRHFYEEVINSQDFRDLSLKYEETLGIPLKITYGIEVENSIVDLQIDLSDITLNGVENRPISIQAISFNESAPCNLIGTNQILNIAAGELSRLTLISNRKGFDPMEEDSFNKLGEEVFDAKRYSKVSTDNSSDSREDSGTPETTNR